MYYKYCIIYFLVQCLINTSTSFLLGSIPFSGRIKDLIQSQSCETSGWSCKDCYTLQRCDKDNLFKFQITCVDQFPDRPYCNPKTGRCVSDRHACTEIKDTEFKCPAAGIYPDVTDCRRYVSCTAKNEIGLIYNCLFESVYNPVVKRCITNSSCYNFIEDCGGEYKTMPYKPDPSLYIVCRGDQKPFIKDCGNKRFEYDPYLLKCDFKCKEEGRFAHSLNNNLYYICVYNDNELVKMTGLCRNGTIYNEFYDTCTYETTRQMIETVTENKQAFETSTTTTTTKNNQDLNTTTENNSKEKTTNNYENYATTKKEGVTTNNDTITENIVKDITSTSAYWEENTTENLSSTDLTTSSNCSKLSTTELTTNAVEEDDTDEDTDSQEQTGEANENDDTNEEETIENDANEEETIENNTNEEETKENNTNEDIDTKEETMENNTNEAKEDFKSNQEDETIEDEDTKEDSNESINK